MHHSEMPKSKENKTVLKAGNDKTQIAYKVCRMSVDFSPTRLLRGDGTFSYHRSRDQYLMKLFFNNDGKIKTKTNKQRKKLKYVLIEMLSQMKI